MHKTNFIIIKCFILLARVTLNLRNNREMIDESLFEMIRKCKMLEYLEFDGVLQSVDFVKDVCDLQCNCGDYSKYNLFLSFCSHLLAFHMCL